MHANDKKCTHRSMILLAFVAGITATLAAGWWNEQAALVPAAHAQIPDPGGQRAVLLSEARRTNELLEQILRHLQSKPVKVQMEAPDKSTGTVPKAAR